jgi:hypothetical protein
MVAVMKTAKPWHGYNTAIFVGAFLGLTVSVSGVKRSSG